MNDWGLDGDESGDQVRQKLEGLVIFNHSIKDIDLNKLDIICKVYLNRAS